MKIFYEPEPIDYLNKYVETSRLLKEAYETIIANIYYTYVCPEYGGSIDLCRYCEEEKGHNHDKACIVPQAEKYLEGELWKNQK